MPFPEDVLAPNEAVRLHLRPHWIVLVAFVSRAVLWFALLYFMTVTNMDDIESGAEFESLDTIAIVVLSVMSIILCLRNVFRLFPAVLRVLFTHYLVTTDRVMQHHGIISRYGRDAPILHVSTITYRQTLFGRLLGYGDLQIETSVDKAAIAFRDVRNVRKVRTEIYALIQERTSKPAGEEPVA